MMAETTLENTNATSASANSAAELIYHGEGLTFPALPPALESELRAVSPTTFATRDLDWTLYDLPLFVDELASGSAPVPYAACGFAGHGMASRGVHYYIVQEHLAVFLQLRWGTAFDDPEAERRRYGASLNMIGHLQAKVQSAVAEGRFPSDRRLVVIQSVFSGSRWTWMPAPRAALAELTWHRSADLALFEALHEFAPGMPLGPAT